MKLANIYRINMRSPYLWNNSWMNDVGLTWKHADDDLVAFVWIMGPLYE